MNYFSYNTEKFPLMSLDCPLLKLPCTDSLCDFSIFQSLFGDNPCGNVCIAFLVFILNVPKLDHWVMISMHCLPQPLGGVKVRKK